MLEWSHQNLLFPLLGGSFNSVETLSSRLSLYIGIKINLWHMYYSCTISIDNMNAGMNK
jgi:hypothetical protein